ncbi:hypothetical protein TcG_01046, partial [Trypanosoma cruzi]
MFGGVCWCVFFPLSLLWSSLLPFFCHVPCSLSFCLHARTFFYCYAWHFRFLHYIQSSVLPTAKMGAPQIVYSALITNTTTIAVTMLVTYNMPNEMPPETVELLIQPGEEMLAPQKLVEEDIVTWTGYISKVAIQGGPSMSEPFPGVE